MATATPSPAPNGAAGASDTALRQFGALRFNATLGQIVTVMLASPQHRHAFMTDLEWYALPAIATNQAVIAEQRDKTAAMSGPIAAVLFASVSAEVDQCLMARQDYRLRLKPEEWASGPIPWLVEAIGDAHAANQLVTQLLTQRFKATGMKAISRGADGKPMVGVLRRSESPQASMRGAA